MLSECQCFSYIVLFTFLSREFNVKCNQSSLIFPCSKQLNDQPQREAIAFPNFTESLKKL